MTYIYYDKRGVIKMFSEGKIQTTLFEKEVPDFKPPENSISTLVDGNVVFKTEPQKIDLIAEINKAKDNTELKKIIIDNLL